MSDVLMAKRQGYAANIATISVVIAPSFVMPEVIEKYLERMRPVHSESALRQDWRDIIPYQPSTSPNEVRIASAELTASNFWKLRAIFGESEVSKVLLQHANIVDDNLISELFNQSADFLFTNNDRTFYFSSKNELFEEKFGTLILIPLREARRHGIDFIEEVIEKGYAKIDAEAR